MNRVGEFEKVSFDQFYKAMTGILWAEVPTKDETYKIWEKIILPTRATAGSAGYDFRSPVPFTLEPGETIRIPTGIRVKIEPGWWLGCLPKSGLGFKYRLQLDNTMGVIDSDYYYSSNEGHIFAKLTNDSWEEKTVEIGEGEGFMQAIFLPYGITYSDHADGVRDGGFGSTGK